MHGLRLCPVVGLLVALMSAPATFGQATESAEPFKVGTFDIDGVPRVGLVLRDSLVIDITEANRGLESDPAYPKMPMPEDMLELIGRYEYGLKYRLYEIVNHLVRNEPSATWSPSTSPTAAGGLREATRSAATGSSARGTTRSHRRGRGSCRASSTAIRWRTSARPSASTAPCFRRRAPAT